VVTVRVGPETMPDPVLPLAGQIALITGACGGIGRACAVALARAGADIAANDIGVFHTEARGTSGAADVGPNDARLSPTARSLAAEIAALGRRVKLLPADVADQQAVETMVEHAVAALGRLDVFVSCAVYSDREPFTTADMDGFRRTIDVSMWGSFYALRASANQMIRQGWGGNVVIVGSPHAVIAFPNCMAYNMAKAAQDQMARTAAMELLPHKIRVNVVHPGWTDTPGERKFFSEDDLKKAGATLPAGRLARPEEIARGVAFLVDPASAYINGITLGIEGGLALPWWSKRGSGTL
jgi:glucose 1-dehydrogenase